MASEKNLQELFHETLKDIYFAECVFQPIVITDSRPS